MCIRDSSWAPGAGLVDSTEPLGVSPLNCSDTSPTASPCPSIFFLASSSGMPATLGTSAFCGPREIVSVTLSVLRMRSPGLGSVAMTWPRSTVSLNACLVLTPSPALSSSFWALACVMSNTAGTEVNWPEVMYQTPAEPPSTTIRATTAETIQRRGIRRRSGGGGP